MELNVFRSEKKYMLPLSLALRLQDELSRLLEPDSYSKDGYYQVRSLYFDSLNNRDFREKDGGVMYRRKIRLRVYGADAKSAKLEMKEKRGDLQHKSSLLLTRQQALAVEAGDYSVLLDIGTELALYMYSVMTLLVYRPVALIEYDRRAFVYPEFNTRITFDTNVRSSETDMSVFETAPAYNITLDDAVVLEVKFDGKLFGPISKVLKKYHITCSSFSKYGTGRGMMEQYIMGI